MKTHRTNYPLTLINRWSIAGLRFVLWTLVGMVSVTTLALAQNASESANPVELTYWTMLDPSSKGPRAEALNREASVHRLGAAVHGQEIEVRPARLQQGQHTVGAADNFAGCLRGQ